MYSLSLGGILVAELVTTLLTFHYRGAASQAVKEGIYLSMEQYGMVVQRSRAVDLLQSQGANYSQAHI